MYGKKLMPKLFETKNRIELHLLIKIGIASLWAEIQQGRILNLY